MVTSTMLGSFKSDTAVRNEFMEHLRRQGGALL
jgi:GTP cyclohydrolase I